MVKYTKDIDFMVFFHVNAHSLLSVPDIECFLYTDIILLKQDENRYNASRGAHLNLKRAEKARILVNKIPGRTI